MIDLSKSCSYPKAYESRKNVKEIPSKLHWNAYPLRVSNDTIRNKEMQITKEKTSIIGIIQYWNLMIEKIGKRSRR